MPYISTTTPAIHTTVTNSRAKPNSPARACNFTGADLVGVYMAYAAQRLLSGEDNSCNRHAYVPGTRYLVCRIPAVRLKQFPAVGSFYPINSDSVVLLFFAVHYVLPYMLLCTAPEHPTSLCCCRMVCCRAVLGCSRQHWCRARPRPGPECASAEGGVCSGDFYSAPAQD